MYTFSARSLNCLRFLTDEEFALIVGMAQGIIFKRRSGEQKKYRGGIIKKN